MQLATPLPLPLPNCPWPLPTLAITRPSVQLVPRTPCSLSLLQFQFQLACQGDSNDIDPGTHSGLSQLSIQPQLPTKVAPIMSAFETLHGLHLFKFQLRALVFKFQLGPSHGPTYFNPSFNWPAKVALVLHAPRNPFGSCLLQLHIQLATKKQ